MCGIVGFINKSARHSSAPVLHAMMDAMRHRGPDGAGELIHREFALGHRRLSIIDLGGGGQPIHNEDESCSVVFNGEIYNYIELREQLIAAGHRFKTQSDTEVIVHAYEQWGEDCVTRFNGMFAFALLDRPRHRVFLARDHLGIKPLYWVETADFLAFASEVKSLLTLPGVRAEVDFDSVASLFTFRYVPSPATVFRGVQKLAAAHSCFLIPGQSPQPKLFWTPSRLELGNLTVDDACAEYARRLEHAVKIQMRADVPVGLFLSGGLDSVLLLSLMRQHSPAKIKTFTIGFEGGERTNENDLARKMAQELGSEHHELMISADDYIAYSEKYIADIEEPVGNESAAAFYFVAKLTSQHVKVALTGQGADEPWAGYKRYVGAAYAGWYRSLPGFVTRPLLHLGARLRPQTDRFERALDSLDEPDTLRRMVKIYSFFSEDVRRQLFANPAFAGVDPSAAARAEKLRYVFGQRSYRSDLEAMLFTDVRTNLVDDLLMVGDKTSMANSIEVRLPYLDKEIVEFAESVPDAYRLHRLTGKWLHKKTAEKWLPYDFIHQKKKGFANPVEHWLRGRMSSWVQDLLFTSDSGVGQWMDRKVVEGLYRDHLSGRRNTMRHLYLLLSFELWYRRFVRGQAAS